MDVLYCCERAEECLNKARETRDRKERIAWHVLAGAWMDYAEAADTLPKDEVARLAGAVRH